MYMDNPCQLAPRKKGAAQHAGLGTRLLEQAESMAREKGFDRLAVISAVGTREYYLERGFERGELYLVKNLGNPFPTSNKTPPRAFYIVPHHLPNFLCDFRPVNPWKKLGYILEHA